MSLPRIENVALYEACVMAVATGESVLSFCKRTKTNRSTISKWQQDPQFNRDVQRFRARLFDSAIGKFTAALTDVADGMISLAKDAADNIKLSAQRAVIENLVSLTDTVEVKARLSAIEKRLDEHGNPSPEG